MKDWVLNVAFLFQEEVLHHFSRFGLLKQWISLDLRWCLSHPFGIAFQVQFSSGTSDCLRSQWHWNLGSWNPEKPSSSELQRALHLVIFEINKLLLLSLNPADLQKRYSAEFFGWNRDNLVIASGTVFNTVLLWNLSRLNEMGEGEILKRLEGHEVRQTLFLTTWTWVLTFIQFVREWSFGFAFPRTGNLSALFLMIEPFECGRICPVQK